MNHLTYNNWVITGLEGCTTMLTELDKADAPLTAEMHERLKRVVAQIQRLSDRAADRVENR